MPQITSNELMNKHKKWTIFFQYFSEKQINKYFSITYIFRNWIHCMAVVRFDSVPDGHLEKLHK